MVLIAAALLAGGGCDCVADCGTAIRPRSDSRSQFFMPRNTLLQSFSPSVCSSPSVRPLFSPPSSWSVVGPLGQRDLAAARVPPSHGSAGRSLHKPLYFFPVNDIFSLFHLLLLLYLGPAACFPPTANTSGSTLPKLILRPQSLCSKHRLSVVTKQ